MAYLDYNNLGRYSVTFYVGGLNTTTTYKSIYITCNGKTSPNLAKSFISSTSNGWSLSGLDCGTRYSASWNITSSGGSTASGFGAITTNSCPVVVPSPGSISWVSAYASTSTSGRISVDWATSSYADYYSVTVRRNGSYVTSKTVYGTSTTISGLAEGTYYQVIVVAYNSSGQSSQAYDYVTTHDFTPIKPGNISWVSIEPSTQTSGRVYLSWASATNATNYRYEIYTVNDNLATSGGTSSTSTTINGLAEHTQYYAKVYAQNNGTNGNANNYNYFVTHDFRPPLPGDIASVTVVASTQTSGRISIAWTSSSNAATYAVEVWRGSTNVYREDFSSSVRETSVNGLAEWTEYRVKVFSRNSRGNGNPNDYNMITTTDLTPPNLFNVRGDGDGRAYITWSVTDSGSGIRSSNPFYVQISSPNGSTFGNGEYTANQFKTFTTDAGGKALEHNAWYYLRVSAYDNANNSSTQTIQVQYITKRPINWTWHSPKTKGQAANITAAEWNSFCTRINQFRIYKNLTNYDFTVAVSGQPMRASQVNQARTAIQQMVPPTTTPPAVTSGAHAMASFINGLSASLNSIL